MKVFWKTIILFLFVLWFSSSFRTDIALATYKQEEPPVKSRWLVLLYQNADDEVLEKDIFTDLNEAELIGSTEDVVIVSQMDRYKGGFDGDGDWTTVKRFVINQDDDLETIHSEEIEDLGELDSGDPKTLVDFVEWGVTNYPAEKYVLILSDHGMGWVGGWNDNDPVPESSFTAQKIDDALAEIVEKTGIEQFELIGFDACLMSQVEAITSVVPYTKVVVASQEVEPSLGWAYASFLEQLVKNPSISSDKLAQNIVNGYIDQDARINLDDARASFVMENFGIEEPVTAKEVIKELGQDITLTATKTEEFANLINKLNDFIIALLNVDKTTISKARSYTQSFENVFGEEEKPSFIDLGHFASLIKQNTTDKEVQKAVDELLKAIKKSIVLEKHGAKRPGATGFTIYFPNKNLYEKTLPQGTDPNYGEYVQRFAKASLWYQFLNYFYSNKKVDPKSVNLNVLMPWGTEPEEQLVVQQPEEQHQEELQEEGTETTPQEEETKPVEEEAQAPQEEVGEEIQSEITVSPLTLSSLEIKANEKITINTEITSADQIAYIYLYTLYYDQEQDAYLTANIDYVAADKSKKANGVVYPDWEVKNGEALSLDVDWEPIIYFITDGKEENDQFALFEPMLYGVEAKDDVYTVSGIYTSKDTKDKRGALLEFTGEGKMKKLLVFYNENRNGPPRIITPKDGDTFTIQEKWFVDDALQEHEGGTVIFGKHRLEWAPYEAFPGKYVVGIVVEDLEGNTYEQWSDEVTISESKE